MPLASARGAGLSSGNYTVVDGPVAEQDIFVGVSGKASILDRTADLHAVPADDGSAPTPCGQALLDCVVSAYRDVNVPKRVKSALCVAKDKTTGKRTDPQHPLFAGVKQTQTCVVTNRLRLVHGVKRRVVRLTITMTGTLAGADKPVRVSVYWPA